VLPMWSTTTRAVRNYLARFGNRLHGTKYSNSMGAGREISMDPDSTKCAASLRLTRDVAVRLTLTACGSSSATQIFDQSPSISCTSCGSAA